MKLEEEEAMELLRNVAESECIFPNESSTVSRNVAVVDQGNEVVNNLSSKVDTLSQQMVLIARKMDGNNRRAKVEEINYVGDRGYYQRDSKQNYQKGNNEELLQ